MKPSAPEARPSGVGVVWIELVVRRSPSKALWHRGTAAFLHDGAPLLQHDLIGQAVGLSQAPRLYIGGLLPARQVEHVGARTYSGHAWGLMTLTQDAYQNEYQQRDAPESRTRPLPRLFST